MNGTSRLSNVTKVIIVAVVAAVLIIWIIVYSTQNNNQNAALGGSNGSSTDSASLTANGSPETPTGATGANGSANGGAATGVSATTKSPTGAATSPAVKPAPAPAITIVTPVASDIWTIGDQNPITWSIAPNVSGAISLLSVATGKSVGVILPEIGPKQTSYTWNTRDVFLNRTDPEKTDVVPGTYKIEVSFDGNDLAPIVSDAFTITN